MDNGHITAAAWLARRMIRDMWSAWVQGFIGDSPQRGARGHKPPRSVWWVGERGHGGEEGMVGVQRAKGVLRDTWVTTLQKGTSIFHHAELFGVLQCEVKHRALVIEFQLVEITAP